MDVRQGLWWLTQGVEMVNSLADYSKTPRSHQDAKALTLLLEGKCPDTIRQWQITGAALSRAGDNPLIDKAFDIFNQCRYR